MPKSHFAKTVYFFFAFIFVGVQAQSYEDPAITQFFRLYQVRYQDYKVGDSESYTKLRGGDTIRYFSLPQPVIGHDRVTPGIIEDFRTELPDSMAERFTLTPAEARRKNLVLSPYRWMGVIEFESDETAPAKPNCTESQFSAEDFETLFRRSDISNQNDFLNAIPKDVLSRFTFLTESESLQRHGVSSENPRVMRFSNDGKFTITYTCNPVTRSYDTIEAMYFDDDEKRYRFLHASFIDGQKKLVKDHNSCLACHGGSDPRPNWNPYSQWPKTLGSDDDLIVKDRGLPIAPIDGSYDDRPFEWAFENSPEAKQYLHLKEKWRGTSCFDSLPWPEQESEYTRFYPYIISRKAPNYQYRNNAYYSIVQTRLNSHRLYRKLNEAPSFERFRIQLAMEAIQCPQSQLESYIPQLNRQIEDGSKLDDIVHYFLNVRGGQTSVNLHDGYKKLGLAMHLMGIRPVDWDFRFTPTGTQESVQFYNHGMWHPVHYMLDRLLDDLEKEIPEIEPYNIRVNWFANIFGRNLMCVDDLAEKFWPSNRRNQQICSILANYQVEIGMPNPMEDSELAGSYNTLTSTHFYRREKSYGPESLDLGKKILQTTCGQCHNGDVLPYNFKDHEMLKRDLAEYQEGLIGLVGYKLGDEQSCEMPLKVAGPCLSSAEKNSVLSYLEALFRNVTLAP